MAAGFLRQKFRCLENFEFKLGEALSALLIGKGRAVRYVLKMTDNRPTQR